MAQPDRASAGESSIIDQGSSQDVNASESPSGARTTVSTHDRKLMCLDYEGEHTIDGVAID
ncbi:MAG: hypothetical protein VX910_13315 [Candidatus Latescibacterota bacterium]|nr:hypothetical protein [Candidatus Latescibacterota bacterium]